MGQIPALQLNSGAVIPESAAILEYLEDAFPTPSLRPIDIEKLALARLFLRIPDIHFQNAPRILLGMRNPADRDPERVAAAFANLERGLAYIDHFLDAGAGPWAVAGAVSIADCALVPVLNAVSLIARVYERSDLFSARAKLSRYWSAAQADPVNARVIAEQLAAASKL
jgi:glutathione S-transferase